MRLAVLLLPVVQVLLSAGSNVLASDQATAVRGAVQSSAQTADNVVADDNTCVYKLSAFGCVPKPFCTYQFKLGDLTPSQSCRLDKETYGKLPQQAHIAFAGDKAGTGASLTWATYVEVTDPAVWISEGKSASPQLSGVTVDVVNYYKDKDYALYNYHATVTGLKPHTAYSYIVGSKSEAARRTDVAQFTTARSSDDDSEFEIAIFGDVGVHENSDATVNYVNAQLPGNVDFVFHLGDISYADNAGLLTPGEGLGFFYEEKLNKFMNLLTPTMTTTPYMVLVGNHEAECHSAVCLLSSSKKDQLGNYAAYNARFRMPSTESGGAKNMWYSFEHGPIHFTTLSSETDFPEAANNSYTGRKYGGFGDQLAWVEADLKKADANRGETPWLVVAMHRAIYSVNMCDDNGVPIDEAIPVQKAFEDLFIKYNVDLVLSGHVHLYSRNYPVAHNKPVKDGVSSDKSVYSSPKAPVYIISGAGGSIEGHKDYDSSRSIPWNVMTNNKEFGIGMLKVSRSALEWRFVSTESNNVLDKFTITKA